jgi:hypothetical protein
VFAGVPLPPTATEGFSDGDERCKRARAARGRFRAIVVEQGRTRRRLLATRSSCCSAGLLPFDLVDRDGNNILLHISRSESDLLPSVPFRAGTKKEQRQMDPECGPAPSAAQTEGASTALNWADAGLQLQEAERPVRKEKVSAATKLAQELKETI